MANTPVRQYIGARYVPIFADPIQWDNNKTYEPLTIVTNQGNSYTSRQFVPTGIDINNTEYWALTGNYNAQIDQYRQEVAQYDKRINSVQSLATTNEQGIADIDANLNALHANSINDATNLYNRIMQDNIVTFGDSWTQHVSQALPRGIAETLSGTLIKQYGLSGAYFSNNPNENSILAQTVTAQTDNTYDKNIISKVIIIAGANNVNSNVQPTGLEQTITAIHNIFPNAKIYWAPSICLKFNNFNQMQYYAYITHTLQRNTICATLNNIFYDTLSDNFSIYQTDNLHLIDDENIWKNYGHIIGNNMKGTNGIIQYDMNIRMWFNGDTTSPYDLSRPENTITPGTITGDIVLTPNGININIALTNCNWNEGTKNTDFMNLYITAKDTPRTLMKQLNTQINLIGTTTATSTFKYPINATMDNNALHITTAATKQEALGYTNIYLTTTIKPFNFTR